MSDESFSKDELKKIFTLLQGVPVQCTVGNIDAVKAELEPLMSKLKVLMDK